ncbi:MAG: hypothetical protein HY744_29820 [Deltaproteobacteria bacterium]|nr:hypothetical protein [Deltaproteobacteria bacterium]
MGKTWLVRDLARRSGRDLVELDFERDPGHRRAFSSNDPREIGSARAGGPARSTSWCRSAAGLSRSSSKRARPAP